MQMNLECIKDVLLYCVNNIKIKKVGNDWKIDKVNLETLYNADELKKYDQIDIMYSVIKLKECHYISIFSCFPENGAILKRCSIDAVSYTHLRAHETDSYLVCRLLLEKKKI